MIRVRLLRSIGLIAWFFFILTQHTQATIYYSKKEAMELAFGNNAEVETLSLFLTDAQLAAVEQLARVKLDSKLQSFYVGKRNGNALGYAAIESHTVRTKPETLLIVLSPDGQLKQVHVLAFHEPPEYQPPDKWFAKLLDRPLTELELNQGVDGIAGATLSVQSALDSIRKVMSLYQVAIRREER